VEKNKSQIINRLKAFGLSDKEIALYLAILSNGPTSPTNLSRASGLKRPTVYVLLEELEKKELIEQTTIKGRQFFKVSTLNQFKELVEDELLKLEKQRRMVDGLIDELEVFKQAGKEPAFTTHFEGEQGIFAIFEEIIESGEKPLFFGSTHALAKKYDEDKWLKTITKGKEKEKEENARIITDKSKLIKKMLNENSKKLKMLPDDFSSKAALVIFGKKIAIMSLSTNPFGVIMENKEVAGLMKIMFSFAWEQNLSST